MHRPILALFLTGLTASLTDLVTPRVAGAAPNLREAQKLTPPGDPNNGFFGTSIAMSETFLAVGAYGEDSQVGAVYVFLKTGTGWVFEQRLTASDAATASYFGYTVGLSGETLVVGAYTPCASAPCAEPLGAVYVFRRALGVWTEVQKIPGPPPSACWSSPPGIGHCGFGLTGLSIEGSRLVVGAPYENTAAGASAGAAYVYADMSGTWSLEASLADPDGAADDNFGDAVAIAGDYAAVGSPYQAAGSIGWPPHPAANGGRVHVFHATPEGIWSRETTLTGTQQSCAGSGENCSFGAAVALAGDRLLVGAPGEDVPAGVAYLFTRASGVWTQTVRLTGSGNLGRAVATDGDLLVAGGPYTSTGPGGNQGAVYAFRFDGTVWRGQMLTASDAVTGDWLGFSVAVAGNEVAAGAPASRTLDGSTYIFAEPELSIADVAVTEGDSGSTQVQFTVTLHPASDQPVRIDFATSDGTATAGSDYLSTAGTVDFAIGETTKQVTVTVSGDGLFEADETFFVNLANPVNAMIADGQGIGTITNDDAPPALSISDALVSEGDSGTTDAEFLVTLSAPAGVTVAVTYATTDGTASEGADYVAKSGALVFVPGVTVQTINVTVNGDNEYEGDETFFVDLANPVNATIADGQGIGTITNDDLPPPSPVDFYTVTPCRVIDTRKPDGPLGGPALVAGVDRIFPITGECNIPATATALSVNIAVTAPTAAGNLRIFAAGTPAPQVSAINYVSGVTRANNGIFPLNESGEIAVRCSPSGSTHFILDVNGYFQ